MMRLFHDQRLEHELQLRGLDPRAAELAFGDLTTYLNRPIEIIAQEYWRHREGEDRLAQQRVAQATDEAAVTAYYASTTQYLYELSYWEASRDKQAWCRVIARACHKHRLHRVMDFVGE